MNKAFEIFSEKEFISHLILFKLYINSKGEINIKYSGSLENEIRSLYGTDSFDADIYNNAIRSLARKEYTNRFANCLKPKGIDYFENWLKNFKNLSEKDKLALENKLPKKVFDFFDFASKTTTVLSFLEQLLKLKF